MWRGWGRGLSTHNAVDPLGVMGDDGVDARFSELSTLHSSVRSDSHNDAFEEKRTPRVALRKE